MLFCQCVFMFSLVFLILRIVFKVKCSIVSDVRQNFAVVLLFLYSNIRFELYFVVPYGFMRNFDAIIRVSNYVRLMVWRE